VDKSAVIKIIYVINSLCL